MSTLTLILIMALGYMPNKDTTYICLTMPPHECNWLNCQVEGQYVFDETGYASDRACYRDRMHFKYPDLSPRELDARIAKEEVTFVL
jgi:hypothetical protein